MTGSVNRVILVGRLGADPETRRLQSGDAVVSFRLATTETWKDGQSGERRERTEWHSVVVFNEHLAKVAGDYLKKGSMVYVEGQLQTRSWEDQSGAKRYATEIVLQRFRGEIQLLGDAGKGEPASARRTDDRQPSEARGSAGRPASSGNRYGEASGGSATKAKASESAPAFDEGIPF